MLGRSPVMRIFNKNVQYDISNILTEAAFELAQNQHGALIVVVRSAGVRGIAETGEIINAVASKNLLRAIFFPRSPLHDGAVVIKGNIIEAARCTLPLYQDTVKDGLTLGMRHRAGLGISETADVISIIVSEETGSISVADNGILKRGLSKEFLRTYLAKNIFAEREKGIKGIFDLFSKQNK